MEYRRTRRLFLGAAAIALTAASQSYAHHAISAKFDTSKPMQLEGIVTFVDWRNPHAHVFVNVSNENDILNWAIELESPVALRESGWRADTLVPGDAVSVEGFAAYDGTRQVWGQSVVDVATGKQVLNLTDPAPVAVGTPRSAPQWPDGTPRLASPSAASGYWGHPSKTVLMQEGANVGMNAAGLLDDLDDAPRVAPFQPWALALYEHRQRRGLRDDPLFLNCKPPGGVRHFQSRYGVELIEDRERERIFVLVGSGNRNYRIIYLDGRAQLGQVRGDDDNPLYYGRSVGHWEGDTLVVSTTGFNEDFWFTNGGLPHTDKLSITERFSRPNLDTLLYEVTIDDPGAYTEPWSSSWELRWIADAELPAYFCQDNRS
jgi:hypothetical protein